MAELLLLILTRAVRAFAERALPAVTILLEIHAGRAWVIADDAIVYDLARAGDGLRCRTSVFGIILMAFDGFHARIKDALHFLHGGHVFLVLGRV